MEPTFESEPMQIKAFTTIVFSKPSLPNLIKTRGIVNFKTHITSEKEKSNYIVEH